MLELTGGVASALARALLFSSDMQTQTYSTSKEPLKQWLSAVNEHLEVRRRESRAIPRPKRNRARERARREARQLFAQYYADLALAGI